MWMLGTESWSSARGHFSSPTAPVLHHHILHQSPLLSKLSGMLATSTALHLPFYSNNASSFASCERASQNSCPLWTHRPLWCNYTASPSRDLAVLLIWTLWLMNNRMEQKLTLCLFWDHHSGNVPVLLFFFPLRFQSQYKKVHAGLLEDERSSGQSSCPRWNHTHRRTQPAL